jgi:hypothetical protein
MESEVVVFFKSWKNVLSIPANPFSGQVGLKCVSINSYMLKICPSATLPIKNSTRSYWPISLLVNWISDTLTNASYQGWLDETSREWPWTWYSLQGLHPVYRSIVTHKGLIPFLGIQLHDECCHLECSHKFYARHILEFSTYLSVISNLHKKQAILKDFLPSTAH